MGNRFERRGIPANERERLKRLQGYGLEKEYELSGTFQHVASMAAHMFGVPMALVSFVRDTAVIVGASVGLEGISEVARDISLCSMAILKDGVTVFENAKDEPCLASNPLVHGQLGLQFYAAAPLRTADGYSIGVVAVCDQRPRAFSEQDERLLQGLSLIIMDELEDRLAP
ncbi:GAF domain-containing protein [Rufibacter psychrotolerans]|uniref:GAF domain-containing protein n=1 Tax=Rufibacter psychrotolerans TaxID=2812556 RepID=UPI0019682B2B|nr:GAF domain-containing protein [Rufibacter sp. SYSU D00308]